MIPLKVTTEYSLLKSLIKLPDLIKFLVKNNIKVCGICDNELFGVMEFYLKCKENNIKPIIGLEVIINQKTVYLYPQNYEGYKSLLKINTKKYNAISLEDIIDDNIFIVLPYESYELYGSLKNKDNLFLSYKSISEKRNALVMSDNVLYLNNIRAFKQSDIHYLKYLEALGENFSYDESEYFNLNVNDIGKANEFVSKINIEIPFDKKYIPRYKEDVDTSKYLEVLANKGLEKRCNNNVPENYKKRLIEELNVIKQMGFTDYFLIVYDYVLFAKKNNILVGPGRGSAAGSLVSYAIGITDIDPIKYDLLFARFLNPNRKKMPDIDIDFEDTKRGEVIDYVKEKYGKEKVALGITFNSMKSKLVLRDISKILKIDNSLFEKFIKNIDGNKSLKDNLLNERVKKYLELYKDLKELYDISMHLENLKKNISTHAAGVVICSNPLDEVIPVYISENEYKTGYAMEYLENLGLLKMDFLGLKNLSLIKNIVANIEDVSLKDISLDDPTVYELFSGADTDDIFQFESNYAKGNLRKLKVSSFEELAIATALVRPGPSNQIDAYIKNKNANKYDVHPDLKDILKSTYGIIIFQEQIMKILQVIAGYSEYEADTIRIAISKKKEDIILKERENFIKRGINKGYEKNFIVSLFEQIQRFAEYGFNKAHSVSYALIAYQLAYLKVHYPIEFNCEILKNSKSADDKKRLLTKLKTVGVKIIRPNINYSTNDFIYKDNKLLLPFSMIKGFNDNLTKEIISIRENGFKDVFDFVIKCHDILNPKTYELLVLSGVLDEFKYNKKTLMDNYDVLMNYASLNDISAERPILNTSEEYSEDILRTNENNYYGLYVGNHPCSVYKDVIKASKTKDYLFKNIKMALLVDKVFKIKTKTNEEMAFINASDETGNVELTLFPKVFKMVENLKENDIIFVVGKSSRRFDKYQIIVNNIKRK